MEAYEYIRKIKGFNPIESIEGLSYALSIEEVIELMEGYNIGEIHTKTPLVIHQRLCHELVAIVNSNKFSNMKTELIPEYSNMITAIEVIEELYPELKK